MWWPSAAWDLPISPAVVRLNLDEKRPAGQFTIRNVGDEAERFRIKAQHFTYSEQGVLEIVSPDENSLAQWLKFNPKEFALPAKSSRTVRFVLVPRGKVIPKREYWGSIELISLKENVGSSTDVGAGKTMTIKLMTSLLIPIFATKGEVSYAGAIKEVQLSEDKRGKGTQIATTINNSGSGSLLATLRYTILDSSGAVVKEDVFGKSYVLPNSERTFSRVIEGDGIQPGPHTVMVELSSPNLVKPVQENLQHVW